MSDEPATELTGACGCGAVRWRLTAAPLGAAYCHCTRCQRRTGSASSVSALTAPGSLEFTAGEELIEAWRPEGGWPKTFCGECGSAIGGQHPEKPEVVILRLGGFDEDPGVQILYRQFTADAAPWEPIPDDGLQRFEGSAEIPGI